MTKGVNMDFQNEISCIFCYKWKINIKKMKIKCEQGNWEIKLKDINNAWKKVSAFKKCKNYNGIKNYEELNDMFTEALQPERK